jgi:hypothetical protein
MVAADVSLQIQNLCTEKDQPEKIFWKAPIGTNIVRALDISMWEQKLHLDLPKCHILLLPPVYAASCGCISMGANVSCKYEESSYTHLAKSCQKSKPTLSIGTNSNAIHFIPNLRTI